MARGYRPPLWLLAAALLLARLGGRDGAALALGSDVAETDADFGNPLDALPAATDDGEEEYDAGAFEASEGGADAEEADFDASAFAEGALEPLNALDSFEDPPAPPQAAAAAEPAASEPSPLRGQGMPHRGMQAADHFHEPQDEGTCSADVEAPVLRGTDEEEIAKALAALEARRLAEGAVAGGEAANPLDDPPAAAAPAAMRGSSNSNSINSDSSSGSASRPSGSGTHGGEGGALPHTHNRHHKHADGVGGAHFGRAQPEVIVASSKMFGDGEGDEEGGSDVDSLQQRGRAAVQGEGHEEEGAATGAEEEGPWHYDLDDTTITVGHSHACVIVRDAPVASATPKPRRRGPDGEMVEGDEDEDAADERRPYTSPVSGLGSSPDEAHGPGGRCVCWGSNVDGQLLVPRSLATIYKPHHLHPSHYAQHMTEVDALGVSTSVEGELDAATSSGKSARGSLVPADAELRVSPPSDLRFVQVSANDHYSCGITTEDRLVCWGRVPAFYGQQTFAHRYIQISAGCQHACGIRQDGSLHCFGRNHFGQATPPAGTYVQVACGWETCCAISTNATLACWGSDFGRLDLAPSGEFSQVSVSETGSACALERDAGGMVCWGVMTGSGGRFYRRAGPYVQVSTSARLTCGIKQDARLDCFGEAHRLQRRPPGVSEDTLFLQISSHDASICGVTVDYDVICFGETWELLHPTPPGLLALS